MLCTGPQLVALSSCSLVYMLLQSHQVIDRVHLQLGRRSQLGLRPCAAPSPTSSELERARRKLRALLVRQGVRLEHEAAYLAALDLLRALRLAPCRHQAGGCGNSKQSSLAFPLDQAPEIHRARRRRVGRIAAGLRSRWRGRPRGTALHARSHAGDRAGGGSGCVRHAQHAFAEEAGHLGLKCFHILCARLRAAAKAGPALLALLKLPIGAAAAVAAAVAIHLGVLRAAAVLFLAHVFGIALTLIARSVFSFLRKQKVHIVVVVGIDLLDVGIRTRGFLSVERLRCGGGFLEVDEAHEPRAQALEDILHGKLKLKGQLIHG
mmetsp:Transcript_4289/g.17227  ORF Transcript_4289/g.17227 Transcript_4289/m.17227 type:complete len:321 (+) Transcript_4289:775-1737(+)